MIFRDFGQRFLGSKSKVRIILYMLSQESPTGERELARAIGLSHVAVGKALKDLESVNLLRNTKIGNASAWSLNGKSYAYEALDLKRLAKNPPLLALKRDLEGHFGSAYAYIRRVALFGSIAEGAEKENSDIDLFFLVVRQEDKHLALNRVLDVEEYYKQRYGNSIHPLIMTGKEAEKNQRLMENIRRGIVIR